MADNIYTDAETRKRVIAGVFENIVLPEIPGELASLCVYVSLTEVRGEIDVMIRYVDLASDEMLMEHGPKKLTSEDPVANLDFITLMHHLPVPHEGVFALEVHVGGELIGMTRVTVVQAGNDNNESGDENA